LANRNEEKNKKDGVAKKRGQGFSVLLSRKKKGEVRFNEKEEDQSMHDSQWIGDLGRKGRKRKTR